MDIFNKQVTDKELLENLISLLAQSKMEMISAKRDIQKQITRIESLFTVVNELIQREEKQ